MSEERERARRARANARSRSAMIVERITSLDEVTAGLHDADSPEERWAAMARLCRSAWLASGRTWPPPASRATLPGEIFRIDHGDAGRAA